MKFKSLLLTLVAIFTFGLTSSLGAQESVYLDVGFLNVVTGLPEAQIYIDGKYVGNDSVRNVELEEGEHYVRVVYKGKLMYAKMVKIRPYKTSTITSENFVDIKTSAPNRGALDREARRLSETKGTVGFGIMAGTRFPASGISVKWLATEKFGFQVSGMSGITINDVERTEFGARVLIPVGNKILGNTTVNGYIAPGYARLKEDDKTTPADSFNSHNFGVGLGVEWAPFDPLYFSGEIGSVYRIKDNNLGEDFLLNASVGVHVFF